MTALPNIGTHAGRCGVGIDKKSCEATLIHATVTIYKDSNIPKSMDVAIEGGFLRSPERGCTTVFISLNSSRALVNVYPVVKPQV